MDATQALSVNRPRWGNVGENLGAIGSNNNRETVGGRIDCSDPFELLVFGPMVLRNGRRIIAGRTHPTNSRPLSPLKPIPVPSSARGLDPAKPTVRRENRKSALTREALSDGTAARLFCAHAWVNSSHERPS